MTVKTCAAYEAAFAWEQTQEYYDIDMLERTLGHAISRPDLERAARILACPVKANPPNWQHGRVLYALVRNTLEEERNGGVLVDIGTAKGFSATIMAWAVADAGARCRVVSVDAVDPNTRVLRNSILECDGTTLTVPEFVAPFIDPAIHHVEFHGGGSLALLNNLRSNGTRVRFAFVDGKHNATTVTEEARLLAMLQRHGDVVLFDDLQIVPVADAVANLRTYAITRVRVNALRAYAIGVRL
jgi:precorrin-6B methylase 2